MSGTAQPTEAQIEDLSFPELKRAILIAAKSNKRKRGGWPVHIWGPPGIGKSALCREVAAALGYQYVDLRMSLLNPVDLRGVPVAKRPRMTAQVAAERMAEFTENGFSREEAISIVCNDTGADSGSTSWWAPAFLPRKPGYLISLDELNAAPPLVQASAYQLILDGKVGEYTVPEDCYILASGNRETDQAVVYAMPSPLCNRFTHLGLQVDLKGWKPWAFDHNINEKVIAFLNYQPDRLFMFDPRAQRKAFPTPRSWQMASDHILSADGDIRAARPLIVGSIGAGVTTEFLTFVEVYSELPSAEAVIVKGDMSVKLPTKLSTRWAFTTALVGWVRRSENQKEFMRGFVNFCKYAVANMQNSKDFAAKTVVDIMAIPFFADNAATISTTCREYFEFDRVFGDAIAPDLDDEED